MKGKQALLAKLLYYSWFLRACRHLRRPDIVIFNYHRIRSSPGECRTSFDQDVFGPTKDDFERQVKWLKECAYLLSESDLISMISGDVPRPRRKCAMITFDDGYRDNYQLAYPVLKKYNVPAIFFIPTQRVDTRQLGWWDIISYLIKKSNKDAVNYKGQRIQIANSKKEAIRTFQNTMKLEKHHETKDLLHALADECQVAFPTAAEQDRELMSWPEIKEVSDNNISIGSHSHTHRVLATLTDTDQKQEMLKSKKILSDRISKEVHTISYPVGHYAHFNNVTMKTADECGYKLGFSFNTGINSWRDIDRYNIKRIAGPDHAIMFYATYTFPYVFRQRGRPDDRLTGGLN